MTFMEDLLHTFLEEEPWKEIYKDNGMPWQNKLRYEGKWVAYGNPSYIEKKAKELEPLVGGFISHIKYSYEPVTLTSKSPKDRCALVTYCNNMARSDVRRILNHHELKDLEWISNVYSLRNLLGKARFTFSMSCMNPKNLIEMGEIAGIDMKPMVQGSENLTRELLSMIERFKIKNNI